MNVISELENFYNFYQGEKGLIGFSENNKPLYFFKVGKGNPTIIAQYSIHAREYVTTYLAIEQIKYMQKTSCGTVYFIPMLNPDGVEICLGGKPKYKANARGVDLNVNFDANWGTGEYNKRQKGDSNYIGERPFSESETLALKNFTLHIKPDATISYHSKGEEVYYYFNQTEKREKRDKALAEIISKSTGYEIKLTPNSAGGYKDWCIDKLKIPAFTVEVGSDDLMHPITEKFFPEIKEKNIDTLQNLLKAIK